MPQRTRVVHVMHEPCEVYIGRANRRHRLPASDWHNPFVVGRDGTRDGVIERYERYLTEERPDLLARLSELRGKVLGCWCSPQRCHGDVLARLADDGP